MSGWEQLNSAVVRAGLCTNCGTCSAVCPRHAIIMDYELEEPRLSGECAGRCHLCYEVCPGRDINIPELCQKALGRRLHEGESGLGVYRRVLKGHAIPPDIRAGGTGGGVVSALLVYAIEKGLIDAAVVTGMDKTKPWRVAPVLASTRETVIANARSKYATSPTNEILKEAADKFGKVGLVGLPCQIHAWRKIQTSNRPKKLVSAIQFGIGLFCGVGSTHIGTEHMVVEACGIPLEMISKLEFRGGPYPGRFQVTARDGKVIAPPPASLMIHGSAFFRDRCLMCLDYSNLLADVAVGDFYHPDMKPGALGWSVIIVRSEKGQVLIEDAIRHDLLYAEPLDSGYLMGAGYEMKCHGATWRLLNRRNHGWSVPEYHMPLTMPLPDVRSVEVIPPYAKS